MRPLIFSVGILITLLGFAADGMIDDPALFQGALTLGGGFIICGLFSLASEWHGYIGAGILGLLGAARSALGLPDLFTGSPAAPFQAIAFVACTVVLITVVRALLAQRARRQLAELEADDAKH